MTWLRNALNALPALAALACAAALSSCGGGGEQASNGSGVGTGGTGSYANGPVTDFGSIVVNGIHFEPGAATIVKVDQTDAPLPVSALQLGMMVEVEASPLMPTADRTVANASRIAIVSQLLGMIGNLNGHGFTIMGQHVEVNAATHMDAASMPMGLASLHEGSVVEVYGFHDVRTDTFVATLLVQHEGAMPRDWVLQGVVSELDLAARHCRIGHQVVYNFGSDLPQGLRNGQTVRVHIPMDGTGPATTDPNPENWGADSVTLVVPSVQDMRDAALDGLVSDIADAPNQRHFRINGVEVDASALPACPVCDSMAPGDRVTVRGTMVNGRVSAASVAVGNAR